jgi:hypothetical protein
VEIASNVMRHVRARWYATAVLPHAPPSIYLMDDKSRLDFVKPSSYVGSWVVHLFAVVLLKRNMYGMQSRAIIGAT